MSNVTSVNVWSWFISSFINSFPLSYDAPTKAEQCYFVPYFQSNSEKAPRVHAENLSPTTLDVVFNRLLMRMSYLPITWQELRAFRHADVVRTTSIKIDVNYFAEDNVWLMLRSEVRMATTDIARVALRSQPLFLQSL